MTRHFFKYLADKNRDIKEGVLASFAGPSLKDLDLIREWQAISRTLTGIEQMNLGTMVDYYEGKEDE